MSSQRGRWFHPGALLGVAAAGMLWLPSSAAAQQQPVTITGLVASDGGVPLVNASVFIQTMNINTSTRGDGHYTIVIPSARVAGQTVMLSVRMLGYTSANAQVTLTGGTITQNFQLIVNPFQLGTVVVTGQGTTALAEQLGTARSTVSPDQIQRSSEPNVITALAAKAPNVNVSQSSGQPGVSTYIQLRGLTTLTASDGQPLVVVDGLPVDNSIEQTPGFAPGMSSAANGGAQQANRAMDLNPDDIENVEILKGPSAAAIYGSRAGQGVILITTKHGSSGQTHYSLKSSGSIDNVTNLPYLQRTYAMGTHGVTASCAGVPNCSPPARGASWGALIPAGTPVFNHAGEMFATGHMYDNAITASGGNDRTTFYLSGAYDYNRGMIIGPNNSYGRTSLRFNGAHQVNSDLKLGANVAFAASNGAYVESSNSVSGLLLGAWRTPATFNNLPYLDPVTGEPRSTRFENPTINTDNLSRVYDNPFFVANNQKNTANIARTYGNITADYQALPWLRFSDNVGADYSNDERLFSEPWSSGGSAALTGNPSVAPGLVTQGFVKIWSVDQTVTGTASHTFSNNFDGSLTLGNNVNIKQYNTSATTGYGLATPAPFVLSNTTLIQPPNVYSSEVRLASFFGQVQANLFKQLSLTAALRDDGASTFGSNKQFSWFPKGSAAWNIIREGVNSTPIITSLKVRAAYGESGTQPRPYVLGATFASQVFGDGFAPGIPSANVNGQGGLASNPIAPNPNLTTERQKEFETGFDLAFLRSLGDVSFTYYREYTDGAIFAVPVSAYTGYGLEYENAANLWNRGFEVSLNLRPIQTKLFSWAVGVNWARNRSQIVSLPNGVQFVDIGGTGGLGGITGAAVVGQQAPVYYGTDFVRCGHHTVINGVDIDGVAGECKGAKRNALYIDATGYPQVDNNAQYVIGDPNRNWIGSLHTDIHIQKFAITALLDVQNGGDSYNGTSLALNYFGRSYDSYFYRKCNCTVKFGQNYFASSAGAAGEGAGKGVPLDQSWFQNAGGVFSGSSSYAIQHSGFAKLREISLAYTFDMPAIQRVTTFSSIEVRVSGRNLQTWTSYKGIDPETSILGSASPVRGIDYFNIPQNRSYVFAVTLNR
jgi:TonB-linked SusC/RagA family outer membrane protein